MPQSLASLYVHVIFSTKSRFACLSPEVRAELFPYMATVLNNLECAAIEIGGTSDHVHVLCRMHKNLSMSKVGEAIKTSTSRWLKTKNSDLSDFHWQNGYGAFSVSASEVERVREYIANQEEHHREVSFQEELRTFFERYGVEYEERYMWD